MASWTWRTALLAGACLVGIGLVGCGSSSTATIPIPSATAGQVRLAVDRPTYSVSEPIGVTVSNTTSNSYYALTGHSACTFLQLQQWNGASKQWRDDDPCPDSEPAQSLLIRGNMREPFSLAPGSSGNANAWRPGTYRIALTYSASSDGHTNPSTAYSAGFTVR